MKIGTKSFLVVLAIAAVTTTGCKSTGWKMPGTGWLAGNREPDAATLAGMQEEAGLPTSPATKYSPNNIASNATQGGSTTTPYGYTAQTVATPKTGLAAQANGYQTGPYQSTTPAYAGASSSPSSPYGGLPNPYGGNYAGSVGTTRAPNVSVPGNVVAGTSVPPSSYPNAQTGYGTAQLPSSTGPMPGSTASYPGVVPPAATTAGLPAYPSLPAGSAASAYQGNTTIGANPLASASAGGVYSGNTTASATVPASSTVAPASNYAPGTTGRSTNYNFGSPSTPSVASPSGAAATNPMLR